MFQLIDKGYMFLTFPKMGICPMNSHLLKQLKDYWDVEVGDSKVYTDKIAEHLCSYCYFFGGKEITNLDIFKIDNIFRFVMKIE